MNDWLTSSNRPQSTALQAGPAHADKALRVMDIALACIALLLLALPMALLSAFVVKTGSVHFGAQGRAFTLRRWQLPETLFGRWLSRMGASQWPVLLHILSGDMAWVGPRPRQASERQASASAVRPGLVNLWTIRRRTAVHFSSEADMDLEYLRRRSVRHDLGVLARSLFVALFTRACDGPRLMAERINICDVTFDNVSMTEALSRIRDMLDDEQRIHQVSFVNPACVNIAARDRGYRRALARCHFVLPDGIGTKIAGDLLGTPIKQNVNGTDLFPRLCDLMQVRRTKVFLLGGQVGVPERVAQVIGDRWPGIEIVGLRDGFFSVQEEGEVARQVRESGADFLLVARGVPIQDVFIDRHLHHFGVRVAMGVGGLFDFVSGRIDRAPQWMRDIGMEWAYRLLQEPKRMWKRYLIGNFTFLARVTLQRLGLRRCANDLSPPAQATLAPHTRLAHAATVGQGGLRAMVFATPLSDAELPFGADFPTALMPLGAETVIEHMMERLAGAGIAHVDLVVSDRPEALRAKVGDGRRWGMSVTWHLCKDPSHPYDILRSFDMRHDRRIMIGHTNQLISARAALALSNKDRVALHIDDADKLNWSGWASMTPAQLAKLTASGHLAPALDDWQAFGLEQVLLHDDECQSFQDARGLLHAQQAAMMGRVPATWISTPWGAHSPLSRVHPDARVRGPVFVGPGCMVGKGCEVGPYVNLTQDVIVDEGTMLSHSIIMPQTHVGRRLDIHHSVVNGTAMTNVRLDVQTALPHDDGIMTAVTPAASYRVSWLSRLIASTAVLALSPLLALEAMRRRVLHAAPLWHHKQAVKGFDPLRPHLIEYTSLRCPQDNTRGLAKLLGAIGPMLDIAQGRRLWFGVRPRLESEWHALRREWQTLLSQQPIGLIHETAWIDEQVSHHEACAAADLFYVARRGWREHASMLKGNIGQSIKKQRAGEAVQKPVWQRT